MTGLRRLWRRIALYWGVLLTAAAFSSAIPPLQTQDLNGAVTNDKEQAIAGAVCTLSGRTLPDLGLTVTTDEKGEFHYPGLAIGTYELACAAVGYEPVARKDLLVNEAGVPYVQVSLPPEIVVREKVEVSGQAPKISQQSSASPTTLNSQQLRALPMTEQKFRAALPLVPGVVRTPDGKITIKGSVENQGMLLVDSAETVDPVTGSFSIDVPIDAVESLDVYKSAYRAEYGRFSGGLTTIQTKAPSNQWHFELNDFIPTPRIKSGHIVGIADNKPRLSFTGPIWRNKLDFAESFTYDLEKQPVRGLAWPNNETKRQGFNSFTTFQYLFSSHHLLTTNVDAFPMRVQFADISSLVPQSASSDYAQQGFSVAVTDRYLLASEAIITTLVKVTDFDSNAHGQGLQNMIIFPQGWGGNYFNTWTRASQQQEVLETFQLPPKRGLGRHDAKVGANFVHRNFTGTTSSHPLLLLRADSTIAERVDFRGPASLDADDVEIGAFVQDHWALNDRLALDSGLRYTGQTIGERRAFAPRLGLVYSPTASGKTIFRGGVGVFYDRVPLLAGDFTQNPNRIITVFGPDQTPLGPPVELRYRYERVDPQRNRIVPSRRHLDSTPQNLTWNLEMDQELRPHVVLRLSYLSSRTRDVFVADPLTQAQGLVRPALLLSNTGGSRYHEFESTLRIRPKEGTDLNISYVNSRARGDINTLSQIFVPFEQPVIRPNFISNLPANVPHRLVAWGGFKIPWQASITPLIDLHSGFPYSAVDTLQNYVGQPNSLRLPTFFSFDLKLTKDFRLPFVPVLKKHKLRGGFQIFNVTNHSNPRDVFNNVASPFFGNFVGFQHRFYDASVDIVY